MRKSVPLGTAFVIKSSHSLGEEVLRLVELLEGGRFVEPPDRQVKLELVDQRERQIGRVDHLLRLAVGRQVRTEAAQARVQSQQSRR